MNPALERDAAPGPSLLVRGAPARVVASHDFRAGIGGHGPMVPRGTAFRLQPPEIFAGGYEEERGGLVILAAAAAGHLFVGDLVPAGGCAS